jgi:hypothetical protein
MCVVTLADSRSVFLRWERLRLPYNAVLLLATGVFLAGLRDELLLPGAPEVVAKLLVGGLLANVCFTAGPLVEAYAAWLGLRARFVTATLFALGTLISLPLVLLFLLGAFGWTIG